MAKTSNFQFTNTSELGTAVTPISLGLVSNYAVTAETANSSTLSNKTAPLDAEEIILFRSRYIPQVETQLSVQNPSKVKGGVQYTAQLEDVLVTTDDTDASFRIDDPMVVNLTIRHPRSGNITSAHVQTLIKRLLGSLIKSDGSWRFDDLIRGAERPITD